VVIVDELAFLTSYELDAQLRKRASAALSLLLSQGRDPAVTVIGAMQDPRKDIVAFRDLFPVRVALRMTEAEQTDMVLGKGARNRGAACELIPEDLAGVGYQLLDGHQHPTRVRAAWVSDHAIDALARDYPAAHRPRPASGDDPVVIDLTDKTREGRER
jgi:S-DNA-T family DNA segregation ATPase FtsK/SpoIIIE